jgi:hypothetical protein
MSEEHQIALAVERVNAIVASDNIPQETASGLAAQSMAQSLAIATADAAGLLRHVESTMSAVQAAALTRWIETGAGEEDPRYQLIVRAAGQVTADAVGLWREINQTAQQLLASLSNEAVQAEPQAIAVAAKPASAPKKATKSRAKKQASKKKAAKTPAKKKVAKKAKKKPAAAKPAAVKPAPVPEAAASNE